MAGNFEFLKSIPAYRLFATACIEAEKVLPVSPAMSAVGSRKALELAVKWVYSADNTMQKPYRDNLQALIHEECFRYAVDPATWPKLQYIIKIGNLAVHTGKAISRNDAVLSLAILFEFVQWIDYCYGEDYQERAFDERLIPEAAGDLEAARELETRLNVEFQRFKEQAEQLIDKKDKEIARLLAELRAKSAELTAHKEAHRAERVFTPEDLSEFATRKKYIDVDLKLMGWRFSQTDRRDCVEEEMRVEGMPRESGSGEGYVDYVLWGKDRLPLAIIEAKRTFKDARDGTHQAKLYADCLEKMTGRRPIIFNTNGYDYFLWDDRTGPQRRVSGVFSRDDLQRLINRRTSRQKLSTIPIENRITDRYYQKQAVRAVCDHFEKGHRKALLVMATGTGKTRTAVSLTDVLSRGGYVTNTLFLADRTALVHQAKDVFKNLLPDMSLCNLLSNKDDRNARVVFSTYPTMLNTINNMRNEDGGCIFSPAHFDLIIVDESHRSIFRKYKAIFDYFDAYLVGLTATPREDVHKSTYEFFEAEKGVPTFAYDYETAIKDGVLVPYYNIEVKTKFLTHGITYDELSPEDKERYEEDFTDEDGEMPEEILPSELNEFIFNQDTVDRVINDLMTNGLRDSSGNRVGKTIIFAQNKNHAQFIVDRFNALYPEYKGTFCRRVVCDDDYVLDLILQFKDPEKEPYIAVSVDMLDTGIDVPEIVNLVFFKRVRSKIKFWQMIGRGTRTCKNLFGPGRHKEYFYIFDYLGNFEFFREHKQEIEATVSRSTTAEVFARRIQLIFHLQAAAFAGEEYQAWRRALVTEVTRQIAGLSLERVDVRLKRKYVDKYNREEAFACLSEQDKREIIDHLADLVTTADNDDRALEFDNIMYGLMLAELEKKGSFKGLKRNVMNRAALLLKNSTSIPQVKVKIPLLKEVITEEFWEKPELLRLETIRVELRDLMKFIVEPPPDLIYTNLHDEEIDWTAGKDFRAGYDLQEYKRKVNKFIEENKDNIAIHKLRNNIPLTETDYKMLERILTGELGTKEDYERSFRDTPFGLLVRRIAKMEREAAYKAFSSFINEQNLNSDQIAFVEKVIDYIVQNGYMESPAELTKPPFDKPRSFVQLFDHKLQKEFVRIINELKENATKITS